MAISREKKEKSLQAFQQIFDKGKIVFFVNFQGMKVEDLNRLRAAIRALGGHVQVIKKTLINKALESRGVQLDVKSFVGEIAAIIGLAEETAVVKAVNEFAKETNLPEFRGGVMGKELLTPAHLKELASIPSREFLLARLAAGFLAPVSGFVNVLRGNMSNVVYVLHAIHEKRNS